MKFRRSHKLKDIAVYGYNFKFIDLESDKLFSFTKKYGEKLLVAALNFSQESIEFEIPNNEKYLSLMFGNYAKEEIDPFSRILNPWEGRIYISE